MTITDTYLNEDNEHRLAALCEARRRCLLLLAARETEE